MKRVARNELMDIAAYEQIREPFRARIIAEKKQRRFSPSDELSLVFENRDTVLFQIQEMLRTERITKESGILHELDTYNELVPGAGELSATLFVEIAEREQRERRLLQLAGLEHQLGLDIDGQFIPARNETRGILLDRTTAVHYLKFALGPAAGAALIDAAKASAPSSQSSSPWSSSESGTAPSRVFFVVNHPHLAIRTAIPAHVLCAMSEDYSEA